MASGPSTTDAGSQALVMHFHGRQPLNSREQGSIAVQVQFSMRMQSHPSAFAGSPLSASTGITAQCLFRVTLNARAGKPSVPVPVQGHPALPVQGHPLGSHPPVPVQGHPGGGAGAAGQL